MFCFFFKSILVFTSKQQYFGIDLIFLVSSFEIFLQSSSVFSDSEKKVRVLFKHLLKSLFLIFVCIQCWEGYFYCI